MKVINIMEQLVENYIKSYWPSLKMPCACEICENDVMAMTLNSLPPRYVSKEAGRVFVKIQYTKEQYQADIIRELTMASEKVAANPSHEIESS